MDFSEAEGLKPRIIFPVGVARLKPCLDTVGRI